MSCLIIQPFLPSRPSSPPPSPKRLTSSNEIAEKPSVRESFEGGKERLLSRE